MTANPAVHVMDDSAPCPACKPWVDEQLARAKPVSEETKAKIRALLQSVEAPV